MVVKKDRDNSDDDYSDDDGEDGQGEAAAAPVEILQQDNQTTAAADAKSKSGANRKTSNLMSTEGAEVKGSSVGPGRGVNQETAPTEASTQEKPSDISTIEY
ncbi:hypothetical protein ElyMa_000388700 [Elysia marginata]|uniref:Uncharacterized protein n=1 Tax=Elysia marginata TaxID=1093978 RepID=A0AAV4FIH1_9GAST|nr:hypothetical protein ElyMa_000388700 [Elysia marginata]